MTQERTGPPRGRRRSVEAEKAVLDAAYDLLLRHGLQATTVEAIAGKAGVSKATIYKWWPNRAAVIMSAFLREARDALPYPDELAPEAIVERLHTMALEFGGAIGSMVRALVAEGQSDAEVAQAFRDGYINARRRQGVELVQRAVASKVIRDVDPHVVLDLLYAPLYYRLLVGHQPLTRAFIEAHVEVALQGVLVGVGTSRSRGQDRRQPSRTTSCVTSSLEPSGPSEARPSSSETRSAGRLGRVSPQRHSAGQALPEPNRRSRKRTEIS